MHTGEDRIRHMEFPKFSIITVTFNALGHLPSTFESLQAQSLKDFEWVVVDGGSTDGSADWLRERSPDFFVSEPDNGIFDAMNRAVRHARGEWLYFLNAGDRFADAHVLSDIHDVIEKTDAELIYGDVIYTGRDVNQLHRFHWLTRKRLLFSDLCHQATFSKASLFAQNGLFDDSLRYNADFDWLIRAFKTGARLSYTPRVIALFDANGAHIVGAVQSNEERKKVYARYCPFWFWRLVHKFLRMEWRVRGIVRNRVMTA